MSGFQPSPFGDSNAINSEASSIAPHSRHGSEGLSAASHNGDREKHQFRSYRLVGEYEKPWVGDKRMKRTRYNNIIVWVLFVVGLAVAGYICYTAEASVAKNSYCLVLDETFSTIDPAIWTHEVQIGGYGPGSFDWTTSDPSNSFVDADGLHIIPTLTNMTTQYTNDDIWNGATVNLTADGTCTEPNLNDHSCAVHSNRSLGYTLPPVRSARLSTKGKKFIKYGRVEVVAKMPVGDWLWPAIWMFPEDSKYGEWPKSGEIDIAEARGNPDSYSLGGRDTYTSTLHWGPTAALDAFWRTTAGRQIRRTDFTKTYHTFGLEWSGDYLYTYLDTRLQQILFVGFDMKHKGTSKTMWERGAWKQTFVNSSLIVDPWAPAAGDEEASNTPFDQNFFLILNVAVGSTNGWFLDGVGNKPWIDDTQYLAATSFYEKVDDWYPTWGEGNDRGMTIKSVKMWQEKGENGC